MSRDDYPEDRMDVADLQELTSLARSLSEEDQTFDPVPEDVWAGIAAQVDESGADEQAGGTVVPLASRRRSTYWLAAVAIVAVVAGAAGVLARGGGDPDVVARAELDALAEGYEGTAFFEDDDGDLGLRFDLGRLPDEDGFYEVWIIKDLESGEMQSLGPIEGSSTVQWPNGFDHDVYATVDISIEPRDGVPTHSGVSVLRGPLIAT